jgi:hypothetical protein
MGFCFVVPIGSTSRRPKPMIYILDISPLKRFKFKILITSHQEYRKPHGQLKENLFLPLFNTNFISKSFGGPI